MQDNKNNIDQSFINDSWKQLKLELDKALPMAAAPNQNYLYLLSSILILSISGLAFMTYLYFNIVPVTSLTKEIIKYQKIYVPYAVDKPFASIAESKTVLTSRYETPNVLTNNADDASDVSTIISNESANISLLEDLQLTEDLLINNDDIETLSEESIENLPSIQSFLNEEQNLKQANFSFLSPRRKKRLVDVYFSFGGFVSNLDYSGYSVGSGIQIPLSKILSLQTGITLSYISKDYFIFPFFEKTSDQNLKANSNPDLNNADTYYSGLKAFKQVIIPLGINYHATSKFSLTTGLKFRYTYSETIDRVLESKAQQKLSKNQSVANTFFNNSNLGVFTGITYKLNDHIYLDLETEWGLYSLISNKFLDDSSNRKYDLNLISLSSSFKF